MPCSPGMRSCAASCLHRQRVEDYRAERARQEAVAEEASVGYATELAEWLEAHPLLTFRDHLIFTRQDVRRT